MKNEKESIVKLDWIDSIKGFAILGIVAFHFHGVYFNWILASDYMKSMYSSFSFDLFFRFIFSLGYLGVGLFLTASGFGLTYSLLKKGKIVSWKDWFKKRALAILPVYWSLLFIMSLIPLAFNQAAKISFLDFFYRTFSECIYCFLNTTAQ
jgi:peptidoglycan/LPS O-acetylase OafA/YrhL